MKPQRRPNTWRTILVVLLAATLLVPMAAGHHKPNHGGGGNGAPQPPGQDPPEPQSMVAPFSDAYHWGLCHEYDPACEASAFGSVDGTLRASSKAGPVHFSMREDDWRDPFRCGVLCFLGDVLLGRDVTWLDTADAGGQISGRFEAPPGTSKATYTILVHLDAWQTSVESDGAAVAAHAHLRAFLPSTWDYLHLLTGAATSEAQTLEFVVSGPAVAGTNEIRIRLATHANVQSDDCSALRICMREEGTASALASATIERISVTFG